MNSLSIEQLCGAWGLIFWRIEYDGGRAPGEPFGSDPEGLLVYDASGWMSATMSCRRRTPFSAASAMEASIESRASALAEYLAYVGRWHLEGDAVVHEIQCSLNPVLIGQQQRRRAQLAGDRLDLSALETEQRGGIRKQRLHRIGWQRAK